MTPDVGREMMMKRLLAMAVLLLSVCSVLAGDGTTSKGLPSSGAELDDILSVIVSTNSPLRNLAGNLTTNLQVSLPPCKSLLPNKTGNTALEPFDNTKAGLRLTISIASRSTNQIVVRADVNFFDPTRGYANMGAEWKEMEFQSTNGHWRLSKNLGGAIK
jgi:hypothetical protein